MLFIYLFATFLLFVVEVGFTSYPKLDGDVAGLCSCWNSILQHSGVVSFVHVISMLKN